MKNKVRFVLGIHNHQPVGNFDHVIEEAYVKAYLPFIETMERYPEIPFALHNSGILWDWFGEHHPEYLERVSRMAGQGRIELMSAGYYEPILTVIPERDRQGQLAMMREYLAGRFGREPRGCWLTERIWDPHLPATLERAGLEYVVVDDSHFKSTGFEADRMRGYFLSEEDGRYVKVFPIDKRMRYMVPFRDPHEAIDYFREVASAPDGGGRTVVLADDGEKFGLWPGTHRLCYEEGWLKRFCELLTENSDWLEVTTFSKIIDETRALGIVYLPTASYSEMMEWALPLKAQIFYHRAKEVLASSGDFPEPAEALRGGLWRNFLVKYEESNWMHKRMLEVSAMVEAAPSGPAKTEAVSHLYQAQCNCAYWHGLFGGLYLPHLRSAIFKHLIEAENALPEGASVGRDAVVLEMRDIDGDGVDELKVSSPSLRAWFKLRGGVLRELDSLSPPLNITDTLTRREEYYHRDVVRLGDGQGGGEAHSAVSIHDMAVAKEKGLEKILLYDRYPRASLVDHFIAGEETFDAFRSGRFEELGDFTSGVYALDGLEKGMETGFVLSREGTVAAPEGTVSLDLSKRVDIGHGSLSVEYTLRPSKGRLSARFAVESVFSMLAGNAPDRYFTIPGRELSERHLASAGEEPGVEEINMTDEWMGLALKLEMEPASLLWRFPVETVSNSDSGFERVYQGSSLVPVWDIDLGEGDSAVMRIKVSFGAAGSEDKVTG